MFPRQIATGVVLLVVAVGGLVYAFAKPKPRLETLEPEQLELKLGPSNQPVIVPSPESTPSQPFEFTTQSTTWIAGPKPIKTYGVTLLSPAMAETFVAPAKVKLSASATRERELSRIDFYQSPDGTVCQSLSTPDEIPRELKIGTAIGEPYETEWNITEPGTFTIIAVASYNDGAKQISPPVVIIVNPDKKYDGPDWIGWKPDYPELQRREQDLALLATPTPSPTLASCPTVSVKALPVSPQGNTINFQATVSGEEIPPDLSFKWNVSAGEIVRGEDSPAISVRVDKLLNRRVVAAVEVSPLNFICHNSSSATVTFNQPPWATRDLKNLLLAHGWEDSPDEGDRRYIELYTQQSGCVDFELLKQARLVKRYFVEYQGMKNSDVQIVNAGKQEPEGQDIDLTTVNKDDEPGDSLRESLRRPLVACRDRAFFSNASYSSPKPPINRSCPDIDEKIDYDFTLKLSPQDINLDTEINTCPYNPRDPLNTLTQVTLESAYGGVYSNVPTFEYWVNAGKLISNRAIGVWDLSSARLTPGEYTVIAKADDGCACTRIQTKSVKVTNFCTPCLTMEQVCWSPPDGLNQQKFRAKVGDFATTKRTSFHWTTTKGKIIEGQGTNEITVDYGSLPANDPVEVSVSVDGLMSYCVNKLSHPTAVGVIVCGPPGPGNEIRAGAAGPGGLARRRKQQSTLETRSGTQDIPGEGPDETPSNTPPNPKKTNEKEWLKISWTPKVSTDDSAVVTVVYKRTSESLQVSNSAGESLDEIKLGKLLKEWFGKDYETFGDVRLKTAGVKCDSCNEPQFQSFDKEELEWSWPIKPETKGRQTFNIELWVKGEPRDRNLNQPSKPAEKVWSKNNNFIDVSEPIITRNTLFAGGGMCAVLGLGLCVRGIKFYRIGDTYNVGQAVAVGRNVTMNNATINQPSSSQTENGEKKDA